MMLDGIACGDCVELMASLDAESLDLVVTSPPYFNAREYSQWPTYQNYLEWCASWIEQAVRLLKPGRMLCINSSSVIEARASRGERSSRYNIPSDLWRVCSDSGLWFAEELVWEKPEGAAINRSQRFSVDRHPMQWRANANTERILVCQKPTDMLNDEIIKAQNTQHRITGDFDRCEVWRMNPEQSGLHPAAFPIELPAKLIRYYSWPGEVVGDPFSGSGTTAKAAKEQGRRFWGAELHPEYCAIAERRIAQKVLELEAV